MASGSFNPGHPTATEISVWLQYREWANTAQNLKKKQDRARVVALVLGVVGAVLGTAAGRFAGEFLYGISLPHILATGSAGAIAIAGYVGRELLTPDRETGWTRSRLMAEAIKREFWLSLMKVPPYDTADAGTALRARVLQFEANTGLKRQPAPGPENDPRSSPPEAASVEDYENERLNGQLAYYKNRSREHNTKLGRLKRCAFVLGLAAVLCGLGGLANTGLPMWVPVITTLSAAVVALIQSGRLESLVPLYLDTAMQLRFLKAGWQDGESNRARLAACGQSEEVRRLEAQYVESCERVMAQENESWRVEWVSDEAFEKSSKAVQMVQEAAQAAQNGADGKVINGNENA